MNIDRKITRNAAKCKLCNQTIESKHINDFKFCKCQSIFVDGGTENVRQGGGLNLISLIETEHEGFHMKGFYKTIEQVYAETSETCYESLPKHLQLKLISVYINNKRFQYRYDCFDNEKYLSDIMDTISSYIAGEVDRTKSGQMLLETIFDMVTTYEEDEVSSLYNEHSLFLKHYF